jgi:hypothetical protein
METKTYTKIDIATQLAERNGVSVRASKDLVDDLKKDTQDKLTDKNITDHDRYVLNYKLDVLKEIRV